MTRIAIVSTELPAFLPAPTAGGGVRIWGIGAGLAERGHEVLYFVPESVLGEITHEQVWVYLPETLNRHLAESGIEIALFEQWQPLSFLKNRLEIPTVVDLPGPLLLEYLWREPEAVDRHIVDKIRCLSLADAFLIATPRQEYYYAPWLLLAGVDLTKQHPMFCPFGLPLLPKCRQGVVADEPRIFFGGIFWPWQNPAPALRMILERMNRLRRGQLVIVGGPHPYHSHPHTEAELWDILENLHTSFLGTLPFQDYVSELRHSAVALDLGPSTVERGIACPLRTGTALWAGTPVMISPDSAWADGVARHNAGWVIPSAGDPLFIETIDAILKESVDFKIRCAGARTLTEQSLDAKMNTAELDRYVHSPERREVSPTRLDRRTVEREDLVRLLQRNVAELEHQRDRALADLDSIRSHPLFRLYKRLRTFI
ncbi:MAG TPA: hypothetical protein PLY86_06895 [bacterium]|nr:hypothetical protein [bacterium]